MVKRNLRKYGRTFKKPVPITSTLNWVGLSMDQNGNKIAQFKPADPRMGRGFSIQTNGNIRTAHNLGTNTQVFSAGLNNQWARMTANSIRGEVLTYLGKYGTDRQKRLSNQLGYSSYRRLGLNSDRDINY